MGILGNMVCTSSISKSLSEKPELVALTLSMLSGRDPPTLVETCRFLNTALSHPESSSQWLSSLKEDEEVFQNLAFILQSSTNGEWHDLKINSFSWSILNKRKGQMKEGFLVFPLKAIVKFGSLVDTLQYQYSISVSAFSIFLKIIQISISNFDLKFVNFSSNTYKKVAVFCYSLFGLLKS